MGKKKGRKRKKLSFTVHEFKDVCCAKCEICEYGIDPFFCFNHVYKQNPKRFIKHVFKNLLDVRRKVLDGTLGSDNSTPEHETAKIFTMAFSGCHFENRKKARQLFLEQMTSKGEGKPPPKKKLTKAERKRKRREARRKARYVVEAYPYFFCNQSFREEIDTVLGNDNQQQDKAEEPAGGTETDSGETTDDTKS